MCFFVCGDIRGVLILIVVDNGLVRFFFVCGDTVGYVLILIVVDNGLVPKTLPEHAVFLSSLNPYCSGQWSRTQLPILSPLILTGLNPYCSGQWSRTGCSHSGCIERQSLNPYCSGQWSRTRPYKTLLIINKLKNFTKQIFTFLNRKLTIS